MGRERGVHDRSKSSSSIAILRRFRLDRGGGGVSGGEEVILLGPADVPRRFIDMAIQVYVCIVRIQLGTIKSENGNAVKVCKVCSGRGV